MHYKCAQLLNPQSEPYITSYSEFDCKNRQVFSNKQIQIIAIAGSLGQIIVFTFIFIMITIIINNLGIDIISWYQIITLITINLMYAAQYIPTDKTKIHTDGYWILHPEEWKDFKISDTENNYNEQDIIYNRKSKAELYLYENNRMQKSSLN